jgi:hypothetical protein
LCIFVRLEKFALAGFGFGGERGEAFGWFRLGVGE